MPTKLTNRDLDRLDYPSIFKSISNNTTSCESSFFEDDIENESETKNLQEYTGIIVVTPHKKYCSGFNYSISNTYAMENNRKSIIKHIEAKLDIIENNYKQEIDLIEDQYEKSYLQGKFNSNYYFSRQIMLEIIQKIDFRLLFDFEPDIEIDNDGEIMFEWYQCPGERANVTFGKNGELYFASLHNGITKSNVLFYQNNQFNIIEKELYQIMRI